MDGDLDTFFHGKVFAERHAVQGKSQDTARQVAGAVIDVENRGACENYLQPRDGIVDVFQFLRPIGVFVDFVDEKVFAAQLVELSRQVEQAVV